jgi:hypothetical protein
MQHLHDRSLSEELANAKA